MKTRESFVIGRVLDCTADARIAMESWDFETVLAAAKSLTACADQMRKMKPENMAEYKAVAAEGILGNDGGVKVESATPKPVRPSGGNSVRPTSERRAVPNLASVSL